MIQDAHLKSDFAAMIAPPKREAGRKVSGTPVKESLFTQGYQRENLKWAGKLLENVEPHAGGALFAHYQRRLAKGGKCRSANIWLRKSVEQIQMHAARFPLPLRLIANEMGRANIAREWSNRCTSILIELTDGFNTTGDAAHILESVMAPAHQWGISPLLPEFKGPQTDGQLDMAASALARLQDADWWERQITKAWRRYTEHVAILVGRVRRGVSAYVSHLALQDYRSRQQASEAWLKTMYAINPEFELEIPLAEAVASSISNPEIRRTELIVRMRGFEDLAEEQGFVGEFYTWTAPSKYHAWTTGKNKRAIQNPRYEGCTPRDTQRYLCSQWAKARAALARLGVMVFGFRVVEPHHDATPHWHLLLFAHPSQLRLLRSTLRKYAIQHHREELGRKGYRARFDYQTIDPAKGSATGYIAKYIAKNIDGHKVDIDEETGESAIDSVSSVAAWSSLWGIRQFQQVGGPSVTVWRELRRLREATQNPILESARKAADTGKWAEYVNAMGGIYAARKDHLIKLSHLVKEAANKYGEDVKKLTGLRTAEVQISVNGVCSGVLVGSEEAQTRVEGWELSSVGLGERSELHLSGGSQRPWSSDNNCTRGSIERENDPLAQQMAMLGLDEQDQQRLLAGSIIQIDGLYVRINSGMLLTSRERPGIRDADPVADYEEREFAEIERRRALDYRAQALDVMDADGDLAEWIATVPRQYQQMALDQAGELIEQLEHEASWSANESQMKVK